MTGDYIVGTGISPSQRIHPGIDSSVLLAETPFFSIELLLVANQVRDRHLQKGRIFRLQESVQVSAADPVGQHLCLQQFTSGEHQHQHHRKNKYKSNRKNKKIWGYGTRSSGPNSLRYGPLKHFRTSSPDMPNASSLAYSVSPATAAAALRLFSITALPPNVAAPPP
jgi:hypothetical protein